MNTDAVPRRHVAAAKLICPTAPHCQSLPVARLLGNPRRSNPQYSRPSLLSDGRLCSPRAPTERQQPLLRYRASGSVRALVSNRQGHPALARFYAVKNLSGHIDLRAQGPERPLPPVSSKRWRGPLSGIPSDASDLGCIGVGHIRRCERSANHTSERRVADIPPGSRYFLARRSSFR